MKRLLILSVVLFTFTGVFSQPLSTYRLCAFDSTYVPLPSTLSFLTPDASYGGGGYYDDDSYNNIPIGFNFVYCGTTYTTISASSNCYIVLGQLMPLSTLPWTFDNDLDNLGGPIYGYTGGSYFNLPRPILAALWTDVLTGSANVRYNTVGTPGNRVFTIEWTGVSFYPSFTPMENVEIKLYETLNWIDFRYNLISTGAYSLGYCAIGITGGSGAIGSSGASGTQPYWSLSDASGAPIASMTVNTRNVPGQPASNQVYRWMTFSMTTTATNSGPVCAGGTVTLTGTVTGGTGVTYLWTGPGGYTSTLLSPTITGITTTGAGVYTFTATSGCFSSTSTTTVTVYPMPLPITGTLSICNGSSTTLADASTGGTWTSGSTSVATVGSTTGIVTSVSVGTAVITYTTTGGCYVTATVTVNPLPAVITGTGTVCVGSTTTLLDASGGGTWTSGSTTIATVGSGTGVVTGVLAGTATVTYTMPGGCYRTTIVTVNPLPAVITGITSVCVGLTTTLVETTGGGTWSSSLTGVATISSTGVVTGVSSGTSTISYSLPTGCYRTIIVTVNPLPSPIVGADTVCAGSTITLTDATGGGTWTSAGTLIATVGGSTGIVSGVTAGTVTISYGLGCFTTKIITVHALPAPITGGTSICLAESTTTLTDATGGGVWSSGSTGVATITGGGVVTGVTVGTSVITYSLVPSGCYVTKIVTVNSLPAPITGADTVCVLSTTVLTDGTGGGTWTSSALGIATIGAGTGLVTGVSAGVSTITYTITSTGCYITFTENVRPLPAPITGITNVCMSEGTTTLNDATSGGVWSSSNSTIATIGSTTGVVTGVLAGSVTITYTLPTSCYITSSFTVNPLPAPITGIDTVCVGSSVVLTDASGVGTWTSSNTLVATIGAGTGLVTGVSAGTTTITFTLATGCYVTFTETVHSLPTPITGSTFAVCSGLTITLTDATGGGTWTSSSTLIATISATGVVTGVSPGVVTISYTLSTGCYSTSLVTVNPLPAIIGGPSSVCLGQTITATDATAGGTWSSSNSTVAPIGSATGIITGAIIGTTIITYNLPTGCIMTRIITVNPLPAPITGPVDVCIGSTITIFDAIGGGTWSSSNVLIASVTGIVTGTGGVTGVSAGTATITYTIGTGCFVTKPITVHPLPAPITGPVNVCELGGTSTLSDATPGGTWSSANTAIATIGNLTGVLTGVAPGITTISYTLTSTGCVSTTLVTVHPLPVAILGDSTVCVASEITLTGVALGGTFTSSLTTIATAGLTTGIITGVSGGVTIITYTVANNCYLTKPITVNALPPSSIMALGDTNLCPGGFVILMANTGSGITYQWYVNGSPVTGAMTSNLYVNTSGIYTIREVNAAGCTATSIGMHVIIDTPIAIIAPPASDTFCAGTSLVLYANTGTGFTYQWLYDSTGIPGAVSSFYGATLAGQYIVIVTNGTGCSNSDTITLYTKPSPTVTVSASGSLAFCIGDSVTLTGNTGYTYQWMVGGVPIPGATNISYTATNSGNYTLVETNSFGCNASSTVITVISSPFPNTTITASGPTTFCAGGFVLLSVTAVSGYTYQWFNSGTPIAGATNSSYLAVASGEFTVRVTNTITGCTDITPIPTIVVLVANPQILPLTPTTFCWGSNAVLAIDLTGATGVSYQWYFNGIIIPGATNITYSTNNPGIYTCVIIVATGCTFTTTPLGLYEYPLPNPIVTWNAPYLTTQNNYVSYQWYNELVLIPGATTYRYRPTAIGGYKVDVIDTNGCQSFSDVYILTSISDTGDGGHGNYVKNYNSSNYNISIFPNPANTMIHIVSDIKVSAVITGIDGRKLIEKQNVTDISINNLTDGVYMLMLYTSDGQLVYIERLVKVDK